MIRRVRQRRSLFIARAVVLLAVSLGLVGQTGLGALGDVHELAEHPDSLLVHAAHLQPHEHSTIAPSDHHEDGDLMHILVHQAHCGAQTAALPVDELELPRAGDAAADPRATPTCEVFAAHSATPFRPPKTA